ncbi:unnamed protein product [Larinioides sclopetarius]|uniref:Uncharacterized protein n=1 Tax=Larinioides sclopetarius TaxID=280406 RepID=A0AAV2AX85_9ARAC
MYTMDCIDPNCVKCKQASKEQIPEEGKQCKIPETLGQNSEEENRKKLLKTLEEMTAKDLLVGVMARADCLSNCRRLKEEVHSKINALISILRERELDLCLEIERECCAQLQQTDRDTTINCVGKLMKKCDESRKLPPQSTLVFHSAFDLAKRTLQCFGQLSYEDSDAINKTARELFEVSIGARARYAPSASGCSLDEDSKTTASAKNATPVSSACSVEALATAERKLRDEIKIREFKQDFKEHMYRLKKMYEKNVENSKNNSEHKRSMDLETEKGEELRITAGQVKKSEKGEELRITDRQVLKSIFDGVFGKRTEEVRAEPRKGKVGKVPEELKLKVVCENSRNLLIADEITGRTCIIDRYLWEEKFQEDNSSGKAEQIEALSRKTYESLLDKLKEKQKREGTANSLVTASNCKSTDSMPDKEDGKDSTLEKDLKEPCGKLPLTDLKKDEKASQSSGSTDSLSNEEVENDSSMDEDDIEIISKNETESIPLELTFAQPLPTKGRFKFGQRPIRFDSFIRKKGDRKLSRSTGASGKSKSFGIGESESQESWLSGAAVSSGSDAEPKESPSVEEQSDRKSFNEFLFGSKDEGRDKNLTAALRSSFTKYLEKNPKSEWLATEKRSDQSRPAEMSRIIPMTNQELEQWLQCRQKVASAHK